MSATLFLKSYNEKLFESERQKKIGRKVFSYGGKKESCRRGTYPKHDGNRSLRNQNKLADIGDKAVPTDPNEL